jgi:hypothetical protein
MYTLKKRPINKLKKIRGGKDEKDNGWLADFWNWWNYNISNTIWFKALSKLAEGIKWTISTIMNFIWYIFSDILTKNLKSVWLYIIFGFLGIGSLGAIAEAGDLDSFNFMFSTGGVFPITNFVSISKSVTNFITNSLGNYNIFSILWLLITTLFDILGWITMDIINLLFNFQNVFVCTISWIIIGTILSSFMIIYKKEIMKLDEKPTKKSIKEKEPKEKKPKEKEPKEKEPKEKKPKEKEPKEKEPKEKETKKKETKKKIKGGELIHPTIERMFEPDLLEKLNQIPKASMEAMIQENPLPFGYAILCGFMKETDTGYMFSEGSLNMIQMSLSNTMNTMNPIDSSKDDWTTVNESLEAYKFVNTASIHAMVRDGLDSKDGQTGGSHMSKRIPFHKIKQEDMEWLSQQNANGFRHAKKQGFLKDDRITEMGNDVVQKIIDQYTSTIDSNWSKLIDKNKLDHKSPSLSSSS